MSISEHGPVCDICGKYILLDRSINPFRVTGVEQELHCHDKCRLLIEAGCKANELPEGPLRTAFAVACKQCGAPEHAETGQTAHVTASKDFGWIAGSKSP